MSLAEWLVSSASTTILVGVLGWLSRNLILTRLKATVQYEFDAKLEKVKADFRLSEDSFKADLRAKQTDIKVLRHGALSGMANSQLLLEKRRLKAAEELWGAIEMLAPFKFACDAMKFFDFKKSLEEASKDPKMRGMFETIGKGLDTNKMPNMHKSRPFVSEYAWALFSAYQVVIGHAVVQLVLLKSGLNSPDLLKVDHVSKLAKAALPHCSDYLDEHPARVFNLLDPLEAELLKELQRTMRGEESDKESIKQTASIMHEVSIVGEETLKARAARDIG